MRWPARFSAARQGGHSSAPRGAALPQIVQGIADFLTAARFQQRATVACAVPMSYAIVIIAAWRASGNGRR